jgi:hypothetical protein
MKLQCRAGLFNAMNYAQFRNPDRVPARFSALDVPPGVRQVTVSCRPGYYDVFE